MVISPIPTSLIWSFDHTRRSSYVSMVISPDQKQYYGRLTIPGGGGGVQRAGGGGRPPRRLEPPAAAPPPERVVPHLSRSASPPVLAVAVDALHAPAAVRPLHGRAVHVGAHARGEPLAQHQHRRREPQTRRGRGRGRGRLSPHGNTRRRGLIHAAADIQRHAGERLPAAGVRRQRRGQRGAGRDVGQGQDGRAAGRGLHSFSAQLNLSRF